MKPIITALVASFVLWLPLPHQPKPPHATARRVAAPVAHAEAPSAPIKATVAAAPTPAPAPPPAPSPPPVAPAPVAVNPTGCGNYDGLFRQYPWNVAVAEAICTAESGGRPGASHLNNDGSTDRGLMQVNSVHSAAVGGNLALLFDPATNIRVAYGIYAGGGWHAWTTFTSGAYTRYLQ